MTAPMPGTSSNGFKEEKSSRFWLWSCLGCLGCGGIVFIAALVCGYIVYDKAMPEKPLDKSNFTAAESELEETRELLQTIKNQFKEKGKKEITLILSERELNLIGILAMQNRSEIKVFEAKINGENIRFRYSMEVKDKSGSGDRFINVIFAGKIHLTADKCDFSATEITFGKFELAHYLNKGTINPVNFETEVRKALTQIRYQHSIDIQELFIKDGNLQIKLKYFKQKADGKVK